MTGTTHPTFDASHWQRQIDFLCEWLLGAGGNRFIPDAELEVSLQSLANFTAMPVEADPILQGGRSFLRARDAYTHSDRDAAVAYLKQCLECWSEGSDAASWERRAVATFHLGLCHRDRRDWPEARQAFERCLLCCERAKREDVALAYASALAAVLQETQSWEALEQLAERAILWVGDREGSPHWVEIWGWRARVALCQRRWHDAEGAAQSALAAIAGNSPSAEPAAVGCFHLLLAQARLGLGQAELARESWMRALTLGPGEGSASFRLELQRLQEIYRERDDLVAAFEVERACLQEERRAGLRVFSGAVSLEAIANEVSVPGRGAILERLLAHIQAADPDRSNSSTDRLAIVCGPPQSGKRSLLDAGVVPALVERGWRVLRSHDCQRWPAELGSALTGQRERHRIETPQVLWERLQQQQSSQPTVLVFDRLEALEDWSALCAFLKRCLQDPRLRVVLALRETTLHRALAALRAENLADLDSLYRLDYFTLDEAIAALRALGIGPSQSDCLARDLALDKGIRDIVLPLHLQLAGMQLEREGFAARSASALLVGYLARTVAACGDRCAEAAWLTFDALVDPDNGERLRKTQTELARWLEGCRAGESQNLPTVLNIAVGAGILWQRSELPVARYELTSAAFVEPIRREGGRLSAGFTQTERPQRQSRPQTRGLTTIGTSVLAALAIASTLAWGWQQFVRGRDRPLYDARTRAMSAYSRELARDDRPFAALVAALRAARPLQTGEIGRRALSEPTRLQLAVALHDALYTVRERNQLERHTGGVNAVAVGPELIVSGGAEGDLYLWHSDGRPIRSLATGDASTNASTNASTDVSQKQSFDAVAIDARGKTIAAARADGSLFLWRPDGEEIARLPIGAPASGLAIAPDDGTIAVGTAAGVLELRDAEGQLVRKIAAHQSAIAAVAFSPDGRWLATASQDRTAKIFDRAGRWRATLTGHNGWVNDIDFSADGQTIATASGDGTIGFWSLAGERLETLTGQHQGTISAVAFSPDGRLLASASSDRTIKIWDERGEPIESFTGHTDTIGAIAWSPIGDVLVSASRDRSVRLWQPDGAQPPSLAAHPKEVTSLTFSSDGKVMASASWDGTVKLWNRAGELLRTLEGHEGAVQGVAFAPNGRTLASTGIDGTVRIWNRRGEQVRALAAHTDWVAAANFAPDGRTLATAGWDGTVKLWDGAGELLETLTIPIAPDGRPPAATSVAWSPDGNLVAAGSSDRAVYLWQQDGSPSHVLKGHLGPVYGTAFSPDGKLLATASLDRTVKLWRVADGLELVTLQGHRGGIFDLTFSPDGELLATASSDGTVMLWNPNGEELLRLESKGAPVYGLAFTPDSKVMAAATYDGTVVLWDLGLESLLARSCAWLEDYRHRHRDPAIRRLCPGYRPPR